MKKDKLSHKVELQNQFQDSSVNEIKIAIRISQFMKFLYKESTYFVLLLVPTLICLFVMAHYGNIENVIPYLVVAVILHPILFYIFKHTLFKDFPEELDHFNFTIEVLEEIKNKKTSK